MTSLCRKIDIYFSKRKVYNKEKEFKKLPYEYGAEFGYSMITDDIKTIEDAINEASISMREDKEQNYK